MRLRLTFWSVLMCCACGGSEDPAPDAARADVVKDTIRPADVSADVSHAPDAALDAMPELGADAHDEALSDAVLDAPPSDGGAMLDAPPSDGDAGVDASDADPCGGICGPGTVCRGGRCTAADAGLDAVDVCVPTPEICDGIDNDCDGVGDFGRDAAAAMERYCREHPGVPETLARASDAGLPYDLDASRFQCMPCGEGSDAGAFCRISPMNPFWVPLVVVGSNSCR